MSLRQARRIGQYFKCRTEILYTNIKSKTTRNAASQINIILDIFFMDYLLIWIGQNIHQNWPGSNISYSHGGRLIERAGLEHQHHNDLLIDLSLQIASNSISIIIAELPAPPRHLSNPSVNFFLRYMPPFSQNCLLKLLQSMLDPTTQPLLDDLLYTLN